MKTFEPYYYTLFISRKGEKRVIYKKKQEGKVVKFRGAVNQKLVPKIYILKSEGAIIYVGFTSQGIGSRLSGGMYADGTHGDYIGYKWKILEEVELFVFVFNDELTDGKHDPKKKIYETIEAELVFKIRSKTGKYPEYQNEIHFYNRHVDQVQEVVEDVYKRATKGQKSF